MEKQHFYTKIPTCFEINSYQAGFKTGVPYLGILPTTPLAEEEALPHVLFTERKSIVLTGTLILANIFWSVFSFTVYIPALKTQGQVLTKEVLRHTEMVFLS